MNWFSFSSIRNINIEATALNFFQYVEWIKNLSNEVLL